MTPLVCQSAHINRANLQRLLLRQDVPRLEYYTAERFAYSGY
jgi:hypothetical protein